MDPKRYASFIIDGADQSAFGLPHFTVKTKSQTGHAIKVRLVGVINHGRPNKLFLLTMADNFESGANHIIESFHRALNGFEGVLPRSAFIQLDNCTKENKNRYFFSFLEFLILAEVFDEVEVGFLPVGHTHEDIDQAFSCTADQLRSNDAITLGEMHEQLGNVYNSRTVVSNMDNLINWSGLVRQENCLTNVKDFSHCRYFRFSKVAQAASASNQSFVVSTKCEVKVKSVDEWKPLVQKDPFKSFLIFKPDLSKTPSTKTRIPDDEDDVAKRLKSEEGRINSVAKMDSLLEYKDMIYRQKVLPFAWDLNSCSESLGKSVPSSGTIHAQELADGNETSGRENDYLYRLNSFVAVKGSAVDSGGLEGGAQQFWIAKVNKLVSHEGRVSSLQVHWYESSSTTDALSGRYDPSYLPVKNKRKKIPWVDEVPSESVVINFDSLTRARHIPSAAKKILLNQ